MIENLFNPFRKRRNGFFILRQESVKSAEGQTPRKDQLWKVNHKDVIFKELFFI